MAQPTEPYCCAVDWVPYCDTCGDEGCPDCASGTSPNHQCARWAAAHRTGRGFPAP